MPTTYKCPSCGAAMEFDSDTQKMKCPQCQRIMDVSEFDMMQLTAIMMKIPDLPEKDMKRNHMMGKLQVEQ